jgi:hypothetical protein
MLGALVALVAHAHAACPSSLAQVDAAIANAVGAYVDDPDAFRAAAKAVRDDASCTTESLPPMTVARLHLIGAMSAVVTRDSARLAASVAGMRAAEPAFAPPGDVAPVGSTLHAAYTAMPTPSPTSALPSVAGKRWRVDGRAETPALVPSARAVFVQLESLETGGVERSWYKPSGAVPDAFAKDLKRRAAKRAKATSNPRRTRHTALVTATTATLAGAGLMYARASGARSEFDATPALGADATAQQRDDLGRDLRALQSEANVGTYGWWGLGATTLVLGTVTAVTW